MSTMKAQLASLRIDQDVVQPPRRRRILWLLGGSGVALAGLAALPLHKDAASSGVEAARPAPVAAAPVEPSPLLVASGYLVARRKAVVSAKVQGRLAQLLVEEGSRVTRGQVVARLESADADAQVEKARAEVGRAEAELAEGARQLGIAEELGRNGLLATDAVAAARSRARLLEAARRVAAAELAVAVAHQRNTVVTAPFGGIVVKKMAEVGESVAPIPPGVNLSTSSGAIVALADLDSLEMEADVSESNVGRLESRQPAEVAVEAFPGRRHRAQLRQVTPSADRTKATVQVKVTLLDRDPDLRPEMSAKVTFLERKEK